MSAYNRNVAKPYIDLHRFTCTIPVDAREIALANDVKTDVTSVRHDVSCTALRRRRHHRYCFLLTTHHHHYHLTTASCCCCSCWWWWYSVMCYDWTALLIRHIHAQSLWIRNNPYRVE